MPEYVYKAVNKKGIIVKNKVEESSKQALIKKLKNNELMPIQIVQVGYIGRKQKKAKKNVTNIDDIINGYAVRTPVLLYADGNKLVEKGKFKPEIEEGTESLPR